MTQQQALAAKAEAFTPKQIGAAKGAINGAVSRTFGANGLGEKIPKALTGSADDQAKLVVEVTRMIGDILIAQLDKQDAEAKKAVASAGGVAAGMQTAALARADFAASATPKFMSLSTMSAYRWFCWAFYESVPDRDAIVTAYLNRNRRQLRAELAKVNKALLAFIAKSPWQPSGHPSDKKAAAKPAAKPASKPAATRKPAAKKPAAGSRSRKARPSSSPRTL